MVMSRCALLALLALMRPGAGLTDKEKACVATHAGTLDNDFMVGTWYEVYRFAMWLNLVPSTSCGEITFTKASADDLERYKKAYGSVEPFTFDRTALVFDRHAGYFKGMLTGSDQVKFLAWDPESVFFKTQKYDARVYKKVNNDYMLYYTCAVPVMKTLLSRRRNQTEEELQQVIGTIEDVKRLETQRFCSPK